MGAQTIARKENMVTANLMSMARKITKQENPQLFKKHKLSRSYAPSHADMLATKTSNICGANEQNNVKTTKNNTNSNSTVNQAKKNE